MTGYTCPLPILCHVEKKIMSYQFSASHFNLTSPKLWANLDYLSSFTTLLNGARNGTPLTYKNEDEING